MRVWRWYRIEIKGTHPLEKMKLLYIQNSTYNMNPHWAEVMAAIQWEIPKTVQEATVPVDKRERDLPNPKSGNGSFQFHKRLTMNRSSVCEDNEVQGWGLTGIGKRVWGEVG